MDTMGQAERLLVSHSGMLVIRKQIENIFPNLANTIFSAESQATKAYNCIAWAANDTNKWWWPAPYDYWPPGVPHRATQSSFIEAFQTLGYEVCGSDFNLEKVYEKVALYLDVNDIPTHMARQLDSGIWTSKLGRQWDITHHTLEGIEGGEYGRASIALRRKRVLI